MTKTEQNRIVAWRLKLLREASGMPRNAAQACRHFGLSRKTEWTAERVPQTAGEVLTEVEEERRVGRWRQRPGRSRSVSRGQPLRLIT
jgi:hypothetical protein